MNTHKSSEGEPPFSTSSSLTNTSMAVESLVNTKGALFFTYDIGVITKARSQIKIAPDRSRALFVAERSRVDFVYNTAALEGNPFTFPEVKTLLDGITVGGHKLTDSEQVLRLNRALSFVIGLIKDNKFELNAETACKIQGIVAQDEALKWGAFRDGSVFIQGADYLPPKATDLEEIFAQGQRELADITDPVHKAFLVFMWGSLMQFFYDGNKRTSRFLCNGILMGAGYPPVMITAKEQLAYNQMMAKFYDTQDATEALVWFYESYKNRLSHFGFDEVPNP